MFREKAHFANASTQQSADTYGIPPSRCSLHMRAAVVSAQAIGAKGRLFLSRLAYSNKAKDLASKENTETSYSW